MAKIAGLAALGALALTVPHASAFTTPVSINGISRSAATQSASGRIPSIVLGAAQKGVGAAIPTGRKATKNGVTGASMAGYNIDLTGKVRL